MNPITIFLTVACLAVGAGLGATGHLYSGVTIVIVAIVIASALKMANTWQKFVILRAGKLRGVKGPGLFLIIPVIDHIVAVIDERIQTTAFNAEQALTKDTVPVNVDAIIFWFVHDAQKAALEHHQLPRSHRSGLADLAARNDRLVDALGAAVGTQRRRRAVARRNRPQDRRLGHLGQVGRDPRRRHPGRPAGRHVPPGPGRTRKAGAGDPRLGRSRDRAASSSRPP